MKKSGVYILMFLFLSGIGILFNPRPAGFIYQTWELDIANGQTRYTRYLFYLIIEQRIDQTWISQSVGVHEPPQWRRYAHHDSSGSIFSVMVYYRYGSAMRHVREFAPGDIFGDLLTPEARKSLAQNNLILWQITDSDYLADKYSAEIVDSYFGGLNMPNTDKKILVERLPDTRNWLEKKVNDSRASKGEKEYANALEGKIQAYFDKHTIP